MAITFIASDVDGGNAGTLTGLTWPTVQAGDLALLVWTGVSTTTWTDPSGWTLVAEHTGGSGSLRSRLYYRVCTGSESGSITLTHADINRQSAVLAVYRGAHPTSPIDAWADRDEDAATDVHACPQVTTGHADCVIVTAVGERVTGGTTDYTPPTGYTERADTDALASGTGGTITALADDGLATSRPSGTSVTPPPWVGTVSTGNVVTWTISVRPAASSSGAEIGRAAETDIARPVSAARAHEASWASEVDAALPVASARSATADQATETDTALPVTASTVTGGGYVVMPRLIVEVAFASAPSTISSYLTLNDPTRGLIGTGKIAPNNLGGIETPIWEDVSQWVDQVEIERGSRRIDSPVVQYEPGTATIVLDNSDRRFDPSNTDGPYVDGDGVTQVRPMRAVRVRAQWNNTIYDLFYGYADRWSINWYDPADSKCVLTATDAMKVLRAIKRIPQAPAGSGETTSARINRILNSVAWPAGDRMIGAGTVTVQATTLEGDALAELQLTADTEIGELYIDPGGRVFFRGRVASMTDTRSATSQATFGDDDGELDYHELTISTDHEQVFNRTRITRVGGTEQTALDSVSVAEYFERTYQRTDLIMDSDAQALTYAQYVLALASVPHLRFDSVAILPTADPTNLFPQVLGRRFGDRITIRRRPPGGGDPIERDVWIRGVRHEITDRSWRTTWTLQAAVDID